MPHLEEEPSRVRRMILTREETRAEADALFGDRAKEVRKADTAKMRQLFVQAPAAQTMAPNLQGGTEKTASVAPSVDAFFSEIEKVASGQTEAQRRYPELLKVASKKVPNLAPHKPGPAPGFGPVAVRSGLSGGSA